MFIGWVYINAKQYFGDLAYSIGGGNQDYANFILNVWFFGIGFSIEIGVAQNIYRTPTQEVLFMWTFDWLN